MTHLSEAILQNTTGAVITLHDPLIVTQIKEHTDFIIIDATLRPISVPVLQALIGAAQDKPVLVRAENTLPSTLQHYLGLGVDGLILTGLHYAGEVEKAIAACLYPSEGIRPYRAGNFDPKVSLLALNDQITLVVEIAHPLAVTQINEIAEVTGINGVLIAPQRLAVAMEKGFDAENADVQQAIQNVVNAAQTYELPFGIEGKGFDGDVDFRLPASDFDLLVTGIEANFQPKKPVFDAFSEDEDEDAGLYLVARRE